MNCARGCRNRAGRSALLPASLERDPDDPSACYVAADGPTPQLLRVTRDSVQAAPFASTDRENIRRFAEQVNRAFLPRPQRALPAIAVGNRHPEISLPAAFEAFRHDSEEDRGEPGVHGAAFGHARDDHR